MKYEKACGAVVFTRQAGEVKYLIIQQHQGFFGFPKGHVEAGETEEETALREIHEEVGIKPSLLDGFRYIDEYTLPNKTDTIKQVVFFLAEYQNQELKLQEEEVLQARLLSWEDAVQTLTYESAKRILEEARQFIFRLEK